MQRKCSNLAHFPFSQLQDSEAAPKSRLPLNFLRPLSQVLNILRWDDIVQIYRVYLYNVILQIVTVLCNSIHPACPLFASCPNYSGMSCKMKSLFYILIIIIFRPIKNKSWKGLIWFLFSGSELGGQGVFVSLSSPLPKYSSLFTLKFLEAFWSSCTTRQFLNQSESCI